VDFLLISPPVGNPGQAISALSVLTAYLGARGWDARQWDLAIDAFHHFHSKPYLERCRQALRSTDPELDAAAARAVGEIEAAKRIFRLVETAGSRDTMRWAFGILGDAGVLMTAASLGRYEHDFRHFEIPGATRDFESLEAALGDRESNPFLEFFEEHALPRLRRASPRAVGISITYHSQLIAAFTLARLVRQHLPQTRLALGGSYLTAIGGDVRRLPPALLLADAIVLHDGEEALDKWLEVVLNGRGDPGDVPNLCLPSGQGYVPVSPRPPHHTDLAALPVPMWTGGGLELDRYLVPKYAVPLPLTRGCHWGRCVYCNISSQTSGRYRWRGRDRAIADLAAIMAETGSNWFDFPVDSFHPRDLSELCRAILGAGLRIEWGAEVLLDSGFTDSVVAELARAGCRNLRFGLESAAPETLKAMRKPTRPESAARLLAACHEHGIRTGVMVIAGFPTETQTALGATYDFLVEHRAHIDFVAIHPYSLVPGSAMARDPGKFGLYLRPGAPVLSSGLPFTNTNPVGMQNEDLPRVIQAMREGLGEHYPDLGALWTAAIGGWMTFPACCAAERPA
jgi:anaerobic magnesium-protoporphyrin IX monomethyl ester cyclase